MIHTKKSFKEHTTLKKIWNTVIEWEGLKIGTVLWQAGREWKIVDTMEFNLINDREDKSHILFECHTQENLWQYIKNNY